METTTEEPRSGLSIELTIAAVMIAALAAIFAIGSIGTETAPCDTAALNNAVETYFEETGRYPDAAVHLDDTTTSLC